MTIHVASLCLLFVLATLPVEAQPPTPPGGTSRNLVERLAALEARVAEMESGRVDEDDLVGTYAAFIFGINMVGSPVRNQAIIGVETGAWDVTLDAGGTGSLSGSFFNQQLWEGATWSHVFECIVSAPTPPECEGAGSESFTWSVTTGTLLITFEDGEDGELAIGSGGRVLIGGGGAGTDGNGWSVVLIMIRKPDA